MNFEFATAQRIVFGPGTLSELPALAGQLGHRAALITGSSAERVRPVFESLQRCGVDPADFTITGEPTTDRIAALAGQAHEQRCDFVVAFGGGSVLDAGKAVAALLTNPRELTDYLEVVGKGEPLTEDPAPCIAIPTTAGTGAEVTRNAVLLSPERRVKVSMRHPRMLPTAALVDPELTLSMPPEVTAGTGLDALTQLLESFVTHRANPLTDGICREGLIRVSRALCRAYINGSDIEARTDMAFGSLCGGLALANAGLGAVHGFAGPIGGMFKAPHGMVCASLLTAVMKTNLEAMEAREPDNPALPRYREAATLITQNDAATLGHAIDHLTGLCTQLFVPGLGDFGITPSDFPSIVAKATHASSMKGNPIELTNQELTDILAQSLRPPVDRETTLYL